jgi:hypothetical protein
MDRRRMGAGHQQIEFRDLASVTGNEEYATKSDHVFEVLKQHEPSDGLYPSMLTGKNLHRISSHVFRFLLSDNFYNNQFADALLPFFFYPFQL